MSTNPPQARGRIAAVFLAIGALLGLHLAVADASAPDDHRSIGRVDNCTTDAQGGCNVDLLFDEKPTAIDVQESGATGFEKAVVNPVNTSRLQYRVTFFRHDGTRAANAELDWYVAFHFGPPDTTPPDTTITSGPDASTNSTSAAFAFTSTESGTFECKLDTGAYMACTPPVSYTGLADGGHTFTVQAIDDAGNIDGTPASHTWQIDSTPPQTTITSAPPMSTTDTTASFEFSANETGSTFECKLDAGTFASCTSPKSYAGLAVGAHAFEVRATDALGNTDPTPSTHAWEITAPAPPVLRPSWQSTGTPTLTFQDEFNDTAVDTSKWERGWFGEGLTDNVNSSNDNCYHTSQVSESGGFLHLRAITQANTCKGVTRPYTSGMVTTRGKFTQHFGSFEARVCLPDADGNGLVDNFPAWWVNGMASGFTDGEIDVVEGLGGGRTKATVHYGSSHISAGKYSTTPLVGCHNFGAEWRGDNVKFYWDGVLHFDTAFVTPTSAQLVLIFNQAVDDSHSPTVVPAGGNDMTVDWVRIWQ